MHPPPLWSFVIVVIDKFNVNKLSMYQYVFVLDVLCSQPVNHCIRHCTNELTQALESASTCEKYSTRIQIKCKKLLKHNRKSDVFNSLLY